MKRGPVDIMKAKEIGSVQGFIEQCVDQFAKANKKLERESLLQILEEQKDGIDLIPRVYAVPKSNIKVTLQATSVDRDIRLFTLGTHDDTELFEITVEFPIHAIPLSPEQIEKINTITEDSIRKQLEDRELHPDREPGDSHLDPDA